VKLAALAAVSIGLLAPAAAQAKSCGPVPERPPATVIVIWGPDGAEKHCEWFLRHGYRARVMPDVPPDWGEAWRELVRVSRAARRPRYVYGWSRAGSVAELLALRGVVDGAIAVGAPSDLTRWWNQYPEYWESTGMTMEERRERSPLFNVPRERVRLLLAHATGDQAVPFWHSRKLHRKVKGSRLVRLAGDHTDDIRGVRGASLRFLADAVAADRQRAERSNRPTPRPAVRR
jgi:Prolyl oligopeptidase family